MRVSPLFGGVEVFLLEENAVALCTYRNRVRFGVLGETRQVFPKRTLRSLACWEANA